MKQSALCRCCRIKNSTKTYLDAALIDRTFSEILSIFIEKNQMKAAEKLWRFISHRDAFEQISNFRSQKICKKYLCQILQSLRSCPSLQARYFFLCPKTGNFNEISRSTTLTLSMMSLYDIVNGSHKPVALSFYVSPPHLQRAKNRSPDVGVICTVNFPWI